MTSQQISAKISNKIVYTGAGVEYKAGDNIKIEKNTISVITTNEAEEDNTIPITSGGVYKELGNINALLSTI